jgi:CRISPR-associated endonuclease Csn1
MSQTAVTERTMRQSDLTLGLDLGSNSIGWALVDESQQQVVAAGVRVFPEGVDNFDTKKEKSKNEDRRTARAMRRQIARRTRRRRRMREALISAGLLPSDPGELHVVLQANPYSLRTRALDEPLSPHELGRVFLHLAQRRGFLSNRKSDAKKKDESKGLLAEMSQLSTEIQASGSRTLGEYLARCQGDIGSRIRTRQTRREMYESEFDKIWESQCRFHTPLLTDELKYGTLGRRAYPTQPTPRMAGLSLLAQVGLHGLIFFQRRLRPVPRSVVGRCELEPKERRCPKADRLAQRFRLLQEVNNLRYIEPESGDELTLSDDQRALLLDKLAKHREMKFDTIRSELGFLDSVRFNMETGNRTKLLGHVTDAELANTNVFGKAWREKPDAEKDAIVRAVLDLDDRELLYCATNKWGLSTEAAERLLGVELPSGHVHLSRRALEKLVPHMERGFLFMTDDDTPSALSEAGYLRRDQLPHVVHDQLPPPPDVANPVVRQALYEVRKVVNAIVREFDKPARIHVELARNAKASTDERQKISKQNRDRELERDAAAAEVRQHGHHVTREAIDRYLLWKEQGEHCAYCLRPISPSQLLGGEADVDHILPRSRCLDNSFQNKVAVCTACNRRGKGNQTPYEWLAEREPERYVKICQWARSKLSYQKYNRFRQKTLDLDKFVERQLNDTRYISRVVLQYLRCLLPLPHNALGLKGQQTATLRYHWGLNTVLRHDHLDVKNRDDHRHHAVDAIVVALTNQNRLKQLADIDRRGGTAGTGEILLDPWDNFRCDLERVVNEINVSHRARRKVAGALHEDTLYGRTDTAGEFAIRKKLEDLTPAMVEGIRDPVIREIVMQRLREKGINIGRRKRGDSDETDDAPGRAIPKDVWREPLLMSSGVPIKKVRIVKRDETIRALRDGAAWVKPGAIHHICLFERQQNGKCIRDAIFVSMLDAVKRIRRREPLIQRTHPDHPDAKFLMSLSRGEMVLGVFKKLKSLVCFKTCASTQGQLYFASHTDARRGSEYEKLVVKAATFRGSKVTVDPLGRLRWAND